MNYEHTEIWQIMLGIEAENTIISLPILLIPRSIVCRCIATSINTDTYPRRPYVGITLPHKRCRRRSEVVDDEDDAVADVADVADAVADKQLDDECHTCRTSRISWASGDEDFPLIPRISGAAEVG